MDECDGPSGWDYLTLAWVILVPALFFLGLIIDNSDCWVAAFSLIIVGTIVWAISEIVLNRQK